MSSKNSIDTVGNIVQIKLLMSFKGAPFYNIHVIYKTKDVSFIATIEPCCSSVNNLMYMH